MTIITREGTIIMDEVWYIRTGLHTMSGLGEHVSTRNGTKERCAYEEWSGRSYLNQEWNGGAELFTWRGVGEHVSTRNGTEERGVIRVLYVLCKGTGYGL